MKNIFKEDFTKARWILQLGLALTILWFGVSQLMDPSKWQGYLPAWAIGLSFISTTTLIYLNAIFEVFTSLFLIFNQYVKFFSFILALHMLLIIFHLGFNEIAVRDFAIFMGFLSLFFMSKNKSSVIDFFKKKII